MRILDLFCGAGGASMGYRQALPDAEIIGVDIAPQPDYPFTFVQADALTPPFNLSDFDLIHASPPCQDYSPMTNRWGSEHPRLIAKVRTLINHRPYVIENVEGASRDMATTVKLCGSMFGLPTRRHRLFETSFLVWGLSCGNHEGHIPVYGKPDGRRLLGTPESPTLKAWASVADGQLALGIDWTDDWHQLREAIPPAYTRYIAQHLG